MPLKEKSMRQYNNILMEYRLTKKDIDKIQAKKAEKKSTTTTVVTVVTTTVSSKGGAHASQTSVRLYLSNSHKIRV